MSFDGIFTFSKSDLGLANDLTIKVALVNWFLACLRETFGMQYFVSKIVLTNCNKKGLKVGLNLSDSFLISLLTYMVVTYYTCDIVL